MTTEAIRTSSDSGASKSSRETAIEPVAPPEDGRITAFRGIWSHQRPPRVSLVVRFLERYVSLTQADEYESFRSRCAEIRGWDDYLELRNTIVRSWSQERLWDCLLAILLSFRDEHSDTIAGYLLIDLEPKPQVSCDELLSRISVSRWYLSNRELPFYLVSRFGKDNLLPLLATKLSSEPLAEDQRVTLEGIQYWASMPASTLSERLHYFEWQEAIEGKNA